MFAEATQRDGTRSQAAPASHRIQRSCIGARRGGKKRQIEDDPVPF
jgi:hypothetical protein